MKLKMLGTFAALVFAAGTAYAAADMKECCKGKECCCEKMKGEDEPKKDGQHEEHQH